MFGRYRAQIGLGAFAIVFTCSLAAVVAGYVSPAYPQRLKVGDHLPSFALTDAQGVVHEVEPLEKRFLMLLYVPSDGLSDQQAMRISDFLKEMRTNPVLSVAILNSPSNPAHARAAELCDMVLLDPGQTLWPVRGTRDTDASISLVDQHGCLKMRADLPPQEAIAERPSDRPTARKALAILTESLVAR